MAENVWLLPRSPVARETQIFSRPNYVCLPAPPNAGCIGLQSLVKTCLYVWMGGTGAFL
jgi:hypothetical protein